MVIQPNWWPNPNGEMWVSNWWNVGDFPAALGSAAGRSTPSWSRCTWWWCCRSQFNKSWHNASTPRHVIPPVGVTPAVLGSAAGRLTPSWSQCCCLRPHSSICPQNGSAVWTSRTLSDARCVCGCTCGWVGVRVWVWVWVWVFVCVCGCGCGCGCGYGCGCGCKDGWAGPWIFVVCVREWMWAPLWNFAFLCCHQPL